MNKNLKKEINKIKLYLNIMFQLHLATQIIAFETLFVVVLVILNKFINIDLNYLYIISISSALIISVINIVKYKKKTNKKYFIYRYIEKHCPALSSSLTTIADSSLKDSASSDFIKETENLAINEIKKIKLQSITPIFDFNKLKVIIRLEFYNIIINCTLY